MISKKSRPVRYQEFSKLLRNPFYKGVARSGRWGIETKGHHEALVDPVTWARVQQCLNGRSADIVQPPRLKANPEFPLRGFVRCATCGRIMTASNSRGKMGKTYPYYRCWIKGCGAAQVRAERLEEAFSELRQESTQQAVTAKKRISELERRKQRLAQAYVYDQAIDRPTYDRELTTLDEALTFANLELRDAELEDLDLEAALGFARSLLTSTSKIWGVASAPRKRLLQTLIFPEGVTFDGKELGTPATAFIFNLLGAEPCDVKDLVEPKGVEPSTS